MNKKTASSKPTPSQSRPPRSAGGTTPAAAYLVFVFGVAVFIAVAVLAAQRFIDVPQEGVNGVAQTAMTGDGAVSMPAPSAGAGREYATIPDMAQRDIVERDLQGDWIARFVDYTALFQVRDGAYQILVSRDNPAAPVYYSRGTYTLKKAALTLTPDRSMGQPDDDGTGKSYMLLAGRAFDIHLMMDDSMLVWRPGAPDPQYPNRNATHPLIQYSNQDFLVFDRDTP